MHFTDEHEGFFLSDFTDNVTSVQIILSKCHKLCLERVSGFADCTGRLHCLWVLQSAVYANCSTINLSQLITVRSVVRHLDEYVPSTVACWPLCTMMWSSRLRRTKSTPPVTSNLDWLGKKNNSYWTFSPLNTPRRPTTNRKSHTVFRLVTTSVTLNDLERRKGVIGCNS